MKRGTTSALKFKIDVDMELVDSMVFAFNQTWLETPCPTLIKRYPYDGQYVDGYIYIFLTQSETMKFHGRFYVETQVNFTDGSVAKTDIVSKMIKNTLFTTFVDGSFANADTVDVIDMTISDQIIVQGGGGTVDAYTKEESDSRYAKTTDIPTTLPASDVHDWAKEETKPTYTADEVGALPKDTVIPTVPTNVSAFLNDAGYAKSTEVETQISEYMDTNLSAEVTAVVGDKLDAKQDAIIVKEDLTSTAETGLLSSNKNTVWSSGNTSYHHLSVSVSEGEKFIISGSSNNTDYAGAWYSLNGTPITYLYKGSSETFSDVEITVPSGVDTLHVNSSKSLQPLSVIKVVNYTGDDVTAMLAEMDTISADNEKLKFENIVANDRILNSEKYNDFVWKAFDKSYFVFVNDDCNSHFPVYHRLFKTNSVPLSVAVLTSRLSTIYSGETESIEEILNDVVDNGGEALAHYDYNLYETSTDDEWYEHLVLPKKTLMERGFTADGVIRANSTTVNSAKGEEYCRKYYKYSDNVGKSPQYNMPRKFFLSSDMQTMDDVKSYIDKCCSTPGIYAFCFHGGRSDEPMATTDNLQLIIDYIKEKGTSVADFSTYRDVYSAFATTSLEQRLSALENK